MPMVMHLHHLQIIPLEFPRAMTSGAVGKTCTMASTLSQILFFNAATGYALTICLAGLAFTTTTLPKISRLPALVAGFVRIFNRVKPGTAKTPVFLTSFAGRGAGRLDEPLAVAHVVQAELLGDLRRRHRVREVLLVREDEQHGVAHLILVQHLHELLTRVLRAVAVVAVHHEDEALRALVVVAPQRADLVLAADVPHGEADVL